MVSLSASEQWRLVFLYLALRKQHLGDVWSALGSAQYLWVIPGIAVYMVAVWARAWRWHYMLRPLKKIPTNRMFPIVTIGYMGNNIYPARAGEVLRAYVLKRHEGVPISASLATVVVERIFDGVVMLAFIFVNFSELARVKGDSGFIGGVSIQTVAVVGTILFLGALAVFLLAAMFPFVTEKIVRRLTARFVPLRFREKTLDILLRFLGGLESLRSPADVLMIFVTSVVIWLLETVKYWFVAHAFGIGNISFFALMLMNGVVNLATTLPSAPGYVGTFDAPGIAILSAYGVQPEVATAYTLVLHAALWLPVTLLGAYFFAHEGLKWGKVPQDVPQEAT